MTDASTAVRTRPPLWRDVRALSWAYQLAVLGGVLALLFWLYRNVQATSDQIGIPVGFDFLDQPSAFTIPGNSLRTSQPVSDALWQGLGNTIRVSFVGIVLATILGTLIGIARLSSNWLLSTAARLYVEVLRNLPLLVIIFVTYSAIVLPVFPPIEDAWIVGDLAVFSNRGNGLPWFEGSGWAVIGVALLAAAGAWASARWRRSVSDRTGELARTGAWAIPAFFVVAVALWLAFGLEITLPERQGRIISGGIGVGPEYLALLLALSLYTASHIAEIVRASIQSVHRGQNEAASALALSGFQRMWYVVLPQAMRIAIPPVGNQYANLMKNSSLGAVISYFELTTVTRTTVGNGSPAVPAFLLALAIYLVVSLVISAFVNLANRRMRLVER
ncbi:MAG: ABC transporter permease subunit [Acidimicrobiales bacterium]